MKVLFLNPPFHPLFSRESRSPSVTKSSTLYWPMFLAYCAGYVEADDNEIDFIDSPAMELDLDQTMAKVEAFQPELIILNTSTPSILNDFQVAKRIKQDLGTPVAIMGTHATAEPVESLEMEDAVDFVISGEAELPTRNLVRTLRGDGDFPLEEIPGLSLRTPTGIKRNPEGAKIEDINTIPWVSKVYVKFLKDCYKQYFYGANLNPLIVILSGRGCPFRCTYCVVPQTLTGHTFRKRDPKDVVDEMEYIYNSFDEIGEIFFEDDTFTADHKHVKSICDEIEARQLKMTFSANARADVRGDLLKQMKRAGCRELCVGFESSSKEVLKNVKKALKEGNSERFMKDAKEAGILIHGCFMVGNPGDTPETLRSTLDFAKELSPNTAQFYPIMAYPGTKAYEELKEKGRLTTTNYGEWLDNEGHHNTTVTTENLSSQDLVDFCDTARREFYLRPGYIVTQAMMALKNPKERYRVFRGFGTLVKHLFRRHGDTSGNLQRESEAA